MKVVGHNNKSERIHSALFSFMFHSSNQVAGSVITIKDIAALDSG